MFGRWRGFAMKYFAEIAFNSAKKSEEKFSNKVKRKDKKIVRKN